MFERIARSLVWLGELAHDLEAARRSDRPLAELRAQRQGRSHSPASTRGVPASRREGGAGAGGDDTGRSTPREPPPGRPFVSPDTSDPPF